MGTFFFFFFHHFPCRVFTSFLKMFSLLIFIFLCFSSFFVALRPPENWLKSKVQKRRISVCELDQIGPKIVLRGQVPFRTPFRSFFLFPFFFCVCFCVFLSFSYRSSVDFLYFTNVLVKKSPLQEEREEGGEREREREGEGGRGERGEEGGRRKGKGGRRVERREEREEGRKGGGNDCGGREGGGGQGTGGLRRN